MVRLPAAAAAAAAAVVLVVVVLVMMTVIVRITLTHNHHFSPTLLRDGYVWKEPPLALWCHICAFLKVYYLVVVVVVAVQG